MARYRKIDPRIWNDEKFRGLSDNGKLAFLFLLTHPHMTSLGAMRATVGGLAEELGWSSEAFREAFQEALSKAMAEHDSEARMIALPNFIRYNPPESPNVIKAWVGSLDLLPECMLKTRVVTRAKALAEGLGEAFAKALPEAFAKAMPYQEQEQKQEQSKHLSDDKCSDQALPRITKSIVQIPECPHQEIIALYREHLPDLPQPRAWEGQRANNLKARWRWILTTKNSQGFLYATDRTTGLDFFRRYFRYVGLSSFLTGRDGKWRGCNLAWLVKAENFAKVLEGQYEDREAA